MEDYLEAVKMLRSEDGSVRLKEISALLGVKMVIYERHGRISLTAAGEKTAKDICRLHEKLQRFLVSVMDINPEITAEDACHMEHVASPTPLERPAKLRSFMELCPCDKVPWFENYRRYLKRANCLNPAS